MDKQAEHYQGAEQAVIGWKTEKDNEKWKFIEDNPEQRKKVIVKKAMFFTNNSFSAKPPKAPEEDPLNTVHRWGNFYFDFDDEENPEQAQKDLSALVNYFKNLGIPEEQIRYYFSGKKGFHAEIPAIILGAENGDPILPFVYKNFAYQIKEQLQLSTLDTSIYCMGFGRQFRLANVKRKNGKYKIPILPNEIDQPIETLQKMAGEPRKDIEEEIEDPELCSILEEKFQAVLNEEYERLKIFQNSPTLTKDQKEKLQQAGVPNCIKNTLELIKKTDKLNYNKIVYSILVPYGKAAGLDLNQLIQLAEPLIQNFTDSASYNTPEKRKAEIQAKWKIAENNNYPFDCKIVRSLLPGVDCSDCSINPKKSLNEAQTVQEYLNAYYQINGVVPGLLPFENCYYWTWQKTEKNENNEQTIQLYSKWIANFVLVVKYFLLDLTNPEEPEHKYFLQVNPQKGKPIRFVATAEDLKNSANFQRCVLLRAKVTWEGWQEPFQHLIRTVVNSNAPTVQQIYAAGFDEQSGFYVFKDFAINNQGQFVEKNSFGFFEVDQEKSLKPVQESTIYPKKGRDPAEIWNLLYKAWGDKAAVGIAWTVASWFVNQVKPKLGFFPFLSLYGDTQTGKTWLLKLLNYMQSLDEEGLPMSKINTGKGEIRKLAQRSGLFKALLEANTDKNTRFNIESILPLYNDGNPLQTTALKTNDNQTKELPFKSSLAFGQNVEPFYSKAQKERVISLKFKQEDLNEGTQAAFDELVTIPGAELAHFFVHVMQYRKTIESEWKSHIERAKKQITNVDARTRENHTIVLGFHGILKRILGIEHSLKPFVQTIAEEKAKQVTLKEETLADFFFANFFELENPEVGTNEQPACARYFSEWNQLNIHLGLSIKAMERLGLKIVGQTKDIQSSLKEHPAFITARGNARINGELKKTWNFDAEQIKKSLGVTW